MPSQGSGSVFAARSSMENLTSTPFSGRDSGSAFMSQYCFSPLPGATDVGASAVTATLVSVLEVPLLDAAGLGPAFLALADRDSGSLAALRDFFDVN